MNLSWWYIFQETQNTWDTDYDILGMHNVCVGFIILILNGKDYYTHKKHEINVFFLCYSTNIMFDRHFESLMMIYISRDAKCLRYRILLNDILGMHNVCVGFTILFLNGKDYYTHKKHEINMFFFMLQYEYNVCQTFWISHDDIHFKRRKMLD